MDFKNCFAPKLTYLLTLIFHKLVEVSLYTVSVGVQEEMGEENTRFQFLIGLCCITGLFLLLDSESSVSQELVEGF